MHRLDRLVANIKMITEQVETINHKLENIKQFIEITEWPYLNALHTIDDASQINGATMNEKYFEQLLEDSETYKTFLNSIDAKLSMLERAKDIVEAR